MATNLLLLLLLTAPAATTSGPGCLPRETGVVVRVRDHALDLCQEGRRVASHRVALGFGGLGKRQEGDGKTPLGLYPQGAPRASQNYGTFVPVGYPTPAQQKLGFTGGAVGIHGPPRGASGALATAVDWTAGCIAVGTDAEIQAISTWIRGQRARTVRLE
jgi:murein L,D-transpeptidase YafK